MNKSNININRKLKNNHVRMIRTKCKYTIVVKSILIIFFSYGLQLYSDGEDFPFGMNNNVYEKFHSLTKNKEYKAKYKTSMDLTAQAGIEWWRAQGTFRWCDVQPEDSISWDFETEDSLVKWIKERGLHLLPVIGYTPKWATHHDIITIDTINEKIKYKTDPTIYPPDPAYWDYYKKYIDTLVKRYKNEIKYWEFLNEPYNDGYFLGTPEQYVEMYKLTRMALKNADPTANILGPCLTSRISDNLEWQYFDTNSNSIKAIDLGSWKNAVSIIINSIGLENIDVVSHHLYNHDYFIQWLNSLREIVGKEKPIWITETGMQNSSRFEAERGTDKNCGKTRYVKYSCNSGVVFRDTVWTKIDNASSCKKMIDIFLNIGDTVILMKRTDWWHTDTIVYTGENLIYEKDDSNLIDTALAIGDTLTIFDLWAEEFNHTPSSQGTAYFELLTSIFDKPNFLNNLKIFFYCSDNTINKGYYPPIIRFGNNPPPEDTIYLPTKYYRQRLHNFWSLIDTNNSPLPAYYILKEYIKDNFP